MTARIQDLLETHKELRNDLFVRGFLVTDSGNVVSQLTVNAILPF